MKRVIHNRKIRANSGSPQFRRFFRHWRNGKLYDAHKYGHRGWPIGRRSR